MRLRNSILGFSLLAGLAFVCTVSFPQAPLPSPIQGPGSGGGGGGGGGGASGGAATVAGGVMSVTSTAVSNLLTGTSQIFGPCTFTPAAGSASETAYIYTSLGGTVGDGIHIKAATNSFTPSGSGCIADTPAAGANPLQSTLLWTWAMTSGAFSGTGTDYRPIASASGISAGVGIVCTNGCQTISATDQMVITQTPNTDQISTDGGTYGGGSSVTMVGLGSNTVYQTQVVFPANSFSGAGVGYDVWGTLGIYTSAASLPSVQFKSILGGQLGFQSSSTAPGASLSNRTFTFHFILLGTAAPGAAVAVSFLEPTFGFPQTGSLQVNYNTTAPSVTVATNGSLTLTFAVVFITNSTAGNCLSLEGIRIKPLHT